ncbi:MAG TPA: DUF29 domain-containing protein [Acetobacteraceae bacterium]|jgi:hypothetical protein
MSSTLYDQDFFAWANEQAALLRAGKLDQIDVENIAEEIESMGRSEKNELVNRLAVLLMLLLKWRYQPSFQSNGWRASIDEQRYQIRRYMTQNPSLKSQLHEAMTDAYGLALIRADRETGLGRSTFPQQSPFTFDQAMDQDFWPD